MTDVVVSDERVVTFGGETFRVPDRVALMPLLRFARHARAGVRSDDLDGLAAMYDVIRSVVADEDWARFEDVADRTRAGDDELLGLVRQAIEVISARPTGSASGSSPGPTTISPSFADGSYSQVIGQHLAEGRPDLALVYDQARQAREARAS